SCPGSCPSLIRFWMNDRKLQPLGRPSHQQIRQMTAIRFEPTPYECYTTTAPIAEDFSCDWANWSGDTFIRVIPEFNKITRVEFLFERIYKQTGTIKPLAFMEGAEHRLVFEAGEKYYFWDGIWGNLYCYAKDKFPGGRDDFLLHLFDDGVHGEILPAPLEEEYRRISRALYEEDPRP
ncbi:hypothetical protein C8R46DRAFT_1115732, partial [Mycena filopes]